MFDGQKVAVVVPAYREALLIGRMLAGVPAFVDRIFVVDDASDDATGEVALAVPDPRITLVRHPVNQGVGAAIATGYAAAFEAGADVAVVMAGDGQMDPEDLPALLAPITHGRADYAKGNRLAWPGAAGRMPLARFVGNHVLSVLTALATGLAIQDSQCGYTALSRRAAEVLPLGSSGRATATRTTSSARRRPSACASSTCRSARSTGRRRAGSVCATRSS